MYFQGMLTIDPSQLTHLERVKPTKGFARMGYLLTGGLAASQEERETFCAVTILQQVNLVMRSLGIDNVVRLAKDDTTFYEDTQGAEGDLKLALDEFAARAKFDGTNLFNTLNLVLEHHVGDLALLLDIRISRTHPVGDHPIKITVNGLPNELSTEDGEEQVRKRMEGVFASQQNYDDFIARHRKAFTTFLEEIEAAFRKNMKVDKVDVKSGVKIVRPKNRVKSRGDVPTASGDYYAHDPVYHGYYGYGDAFFYAWLWSDSCHSNHIHCHDCTIVDASGAEVLEVGALGFQGGEGDTLNVDEPFSVPDSGDVQVFHGHDYAADVSDRTGGSFDSISGGSESGGWLSSFADSSDGGSDGGSGCGGSSCGSGCGGCGGN